MESLLVHLATIIPYLRQGSGGPLYGEPETRKCRMEPGTGHKVVYKKPGGVIQETVANMLMFCLGDPIPVYSRVVWEGQEMLVIRCQQMLGPGLHHLEVALESQWNPRPDPVGSGPKCCPERQCCREPPGT